MSQIGNYKSQLSEAVGRGALTNNLPVLTKKYRLMKRVLVFSLAVAFLTLLFSGIALHYTIQKEAIPFNVRIVFTWFAGNVGLFWIVYYSVLLIERRSIHVDEFKKQRKSRRNVGDDMPE